MIRLKKILYYCGVSSLLFTLSACGLPCEEGDPNLEIYQNEIALESGERLVIGDIVIGGGFQGGGAPAFGAWLDFRVFGTSRYRFDGITISIFEADQQIGFGGISPDFEFEEALCQVEGAYWTMRPHISFPDAESIFDLDGLEVRMEVELITKTPISEEYFLKLYVE